MEANREVKKQQPLITRDKSKVKEGNVDAIATIK